MSMEWDLEGTKKAEREKENKNRFYRDYESVESLSPINVNTGCQIAVFSRDI
jgi:hypothetical protein